MEYKKYLLYIFLFIVSVIKDCEIFKCLTFYFIDLQSFTTPHNTQRCKNTGSIRIRGLSELCGVDHNTIIQYLLIV